MILPHGAARPVRARRPRTVHRLLLAAAVLLPAALLPGAAAAAPEQGFLVVEGRGGTTAEWVLKGETALLADPLPELTGGGAYAGVLLERLDGGSADRTGAVQVRAFADRTREVVAPLAADSLLEPGRYRVTLLGQGPVQARYALRDQDREGLHVVPRTRIPVTFLGRAEQLPFGQSSARVELPRAAAAGKRVAQVALLDGTAVDDMRMCAPAGGTCDEVPPVCLPSPAPCGDRAPRVRTGEPAAYARLHLPVAAPRTLLWSVSGYRTAEDRLRAAAIIF